jgi:hypothetical protein
MSVGNHACLVATVVLAVEHEMGPNLLVTDRRVASKAIIPKGVLFMELVKL